MIGPRPPDRGRMQVVGGNRNLWQRVAADEIPAGLALPCASREEYPEVDTKSCIRLTDKSGIFIPQSGIKELGELGGCQPPAKGLLMLLQEFNEADRAEIVAVLRPCLDIRRWVDQIADGRPFSSARDLVLFARRAASPFSAREVESALAHHPRIGERAAGHSLEAKLSRSEQQGLGTVSAAVTAALAVANKRYEEKFGQVFLIRAAGRSNEEVLEAIQVRISHSAAEEEYVVQQQLREIAVHRLEGMMSE